MVRKENAVGNLKRPGVVMPISIHITLLLLWKTISYPKFLIYNKKQKPIQSPCNLCNSVLEINGHERKVKVIFQKSLKKKRKVVFA